MQKAISGLGAVLGGAALLKYVTEAREADKVQAQLIQALRKTGQTGALDLETLNAQAAALQRVSTNIQKAEIGGEGGIRTLVRFP